MKLQLFADNVIVWKAKATDLTIRIKQSVARFKISLWVSTEFLNRNKNRLENKF